MGMSMKRGSTYPIELTFNGIDLTAAEWLIVSIQPKGGGTLEFAMDELSVAYEDDVSTVTVTLTQEQSLACKRSIEIDCNWQIDGQRGGAIPEKVSMTDTLLGRVVGT